MFLPQSFATALLMMLAGMVCWGSWANPYKLTPGRRFELFYWDYVIGIFLTAVAGALTLGSLFGTPTSLENLAGAGAASMGYALLAGVVLNCGNVLLMAGIALVGMAVAFPIALGLSIVAGTALSYMVNPRGNAAFLFTGVALVFVAVVLSSLAYRARESGAAKPPLKGLLICTASGILFCGFTPLVAKAFAAPQPVGPYGAAVLFTAGALLSTFPLMGYFMRHPVEGAPLAASEFFKGTRREHLAGLFGGLIWGTGTVLTFAAADYVGMALAGAIGQANCMVAAIWGVFVWREFRGAPLKPKLFLAAMFLFYAAGIAAIALSHEAAPAPFETAAAAAQGGSRPALLVLRDNARGIEASTAPSEGGELSSFRVRRHGQWIELLYRANDYTPTPGWRGKAPFLWPATGRNFAPGVRPDAALDAIGAYDWQGRRYPIPLHGFARSMGWQVESHTASADGARAVLRLSDAPETRRYYPFGFTLRAAYTLADGRLSILYTVAAAPDNREEMFFSIGNHITVRVPFVEGGDARAVEMETPSTVEYLKTPEGIPTGESRPRSVPPAVRLGEFDARTAVSLGGYTGEPWLRLTDPAGVALTFRHHADSMPAPPLVQFNLWGDPSQGYFSPEPWVGLQGSFVSRQGLVTLAPGREWQWQIDLKPEVR